MEFIRNTEIKSCGSVNRQFALFKCEKCGLQVEKQKRLGLINKTCGCNHNYVGSTINGFKIISQKVVSQRHKCIAICPYCKSEKEYFVTSLKNQKSCGCMNKEFYFQAHTTHGLSSHRLYTIHRGMLQRCFNKNAKSYQRYGARGITMCNEWKNDFKSFYDWAILNGYDDELSIDRIDNNGNYEPSNCRWAGDEIQNRNKGKRKNNTTGFIGVSYIKERKLYLASITVSKVQIKLGVAKTAEEASKIYDSYVFDNNLEHSTNVARENWKQYGGSEDIDNG